MVETRSQGFKSSHCLQLGSLGTVISALYVSVSLSEKEKKNEVKTNFLLDSYWRAKIEVTPAKPIPTDKVKNPIIWGQAVSYFNKTCNSI